ncbi:MAG: isochorismate synthase [Balneolaceae bacterium]
MKEETTHHTGSDLDKPSTGRREAWALTPSEISEITEVIRNAQQQTSQRSEWLTVSLPVPETDPLALLEQFTEEQEIYYWEQQDHDFSLASGGAATVLKTTGRNRFEEMGSLVRSLHKRIVNWSPIQHSLAEPLLLGGYSFSDYAVRSPWNRFGAARFILPEWTLKRSGRLCLLSLAVPIKEEDPEQLTTRLVNKLKKFSSIQQKLQEHTFRPGKERSGILKIQESSETREVWNRKVNRLRQNIHAGEYKKVVLARTLDLTSEEPIQATRVVHTLRYRYSGCYTFLIRAAGGPCFAGSTPERLLSLRKQSMLTEGLAGSTPRGKSASEDASLGLNLLGSKKERSEHRYVVRDIERALEPVSEEIDFPSTPVIKRLQNVQHLYTPIRARIREGYGIHELAGRLHPTPAVGGYPSTSAIPAIEELEPFDRGWYAGPVGWCTTDGSGEFAVAIRSALIEGSSARLFAGCGIVADSDPDREWNETELKLEPLLEALGQAASG